MADNDVNEVATDPRADQTHNEFNESDLQREHRNSLFLNMNTPMYILPRHNYHRSHHKRHHHKHHHSKSSSHLANESQTFIPLSERISSILEGEGLSNESHPLFSEMETLCITENGDIEWKENARWVRFEEDVEEGGNRWSKPHVGTLALNSLFEVRSYFANGTVMFDVESTTLEDIVDVVIDNLINLAVIDFNIREQLRDILLRRHKHLHSKTKRNKDDGSHGGMSSNTTLSLIKSFTDIGKSAKAGICSSSDVTGLSGSPTGNGVSENGAQNLNDFAKQNLHFMRKLPPETETANILVGEAKFLSHTISVFIRLKHACVLGDLTEIPVPTRFIFILLGPVGNICRYHEGGRVMATLLCDEVFHDVAYKAVSRRHLLAATDEFLSAASVLPPGEWDPNIRIEPPPVVPSQEPRRKGGSKEENTEKDDEFEEEMHRINSGLVRTGRLFGGLVNDVKRKSIWYVSDFVDGMCSQALASFIFLYFACLTPIVAFGGLLGETTELRMGAIESLVSGLISGVIYGLFSGQPLTILGSTGPVLVFEEILFRLCKKFHFAYLSFRLWTGLWISLLLFLLVALDASAFVCYITRFTEENFATLIAFIFIVKSFEKVSKIAYQQPPTLYLDANCSCAPTSFTPQSLLANLTNVTTGHDCYFKYNATIEGTNCPGYTDPLHPLVANYSSQSVFLMSVILFTMTFLIAVLLKNFKSASFFPAKIRSYISDFAVIIAIATMCLVDYCVGANTPKLNVPSELTPSWSGRGWVIQAFDGNPWWTSLAAFFPGFLGMILIFMDQQITAVIINRKEHKLKKGGGYHLDLFILSILIVINSILGLPWFVAATVLAINHVNSLKIESKCAAPGEQPKFLGIRENRVTHVAIFITIGLSVLMTQLLQKIPMPVLFGVFMYMGVSALQSLQFYNRLLIMFMPLKYQPDYPFLRQVPIKRVHMFTGIQLLCLVALWLIKSFKATSILFPIMLVFMVAIRKQLERVFTTRELKILDDTMPPFCAKKNKTIQSEQATEEGVDYAGQPNGQTNMEKLRTNSHEMINLSEEVTKSDVWKEAVDFSNHSVLRSADANGLLSSSSRKHKPRKKTNRRTNNACDYKLNEEDEIEDGMLKRMDGGDGGGPSIGSADKPWFRRFSVARPDVV